MWIWDPKVRELAAALHTGGFLFWRGMDPRSGLFAAVFAAACVLAGIEAIRRSR
jgi:hypothetical protein